jgi:hypothetical protein
MIPSGDAAAKRVECRLIDGKHVLFGINMPKPGGPLKEAHGEIIWVKHQKCFWIDKKASERAEESSADAPAQAG